MLLKSIRSQNGHSACVAQGEKSRADGGAFLFDLQQLCISVDQGNAFGSRYPLFQGPLQAVLTDQVFESEQLTHLLTMLQGIVGLDSVLDPVNLLGERPRQPIAGGRVAKRIERPIGRAIGAQEFELFLIDEIMVAFAAEFRLVAGRDGEGIGGG